MAGLRYLQDRRLLIAAIVVAAGVGAAAYLERQREDEHAEIVGTVSALGRERAVPEALAYKLQRLDAAADDWDSEVRAAQTKALLERLAGVLRGSAGIGADSLRGIAAPGFSVTHVAGPAPGGPVAGRLTFTAGLALDGPGGADEPVERTLARALSALVRGFAGDRRVEFKQFRVSDLEGGVFSTAAHVQVSGAATAGGFEQVSAVWDLDWRRAAGGGPRLARLTLRDVERVHNAGPALFEDITAAVLGDVPGYRDHLRRGIGYWNSRLDKTLGTSIFGHHGLAVADFDGDGLEDLYLCQPGGLPNLLLMRMPEGGARDRAAAAGVDFLDLSQAALGADFDGDGNQDLIVSAGALVFLAGDGAGGFREAARLPSSDVFGLSAADYDNDGDLDLYVCRYATTDLSIPAPYHDANNGESNLLLRNDGAFRFTDATADSGLDANNRRYSFAASWADYDADGDVDLYVANDFGRNNLYRNEGGRFTDVAQQAGVEDLSAGMSVSWSDCDEDGTLDLYVGNMFSSAGNRIAYQRNFRPGSGPASQRAYQRHARGNTLFANRGDGTFADISLASGASMGRWAWASRFVDVDNDGREDLAIANGYITNSRADDL